jgi:WD40 repeat protein/serine/threonine protein kinase
MMTDPKRVQAVFLAAAEEPSPPGRAAVLDRECGPDAELRRRVEALLKAHDAPGSFLDRPADPGTGASTPDPGTSSEPLAAPEAPGTQVGPYTLLEELGEGGFGVVFLAEQQRPVRRTVALKILKPGMDSKQVVARFEAERQALALMDHPNIARVFDAGTTASGRPYFVMELVRGVPITQFCDEHRLTPKERLGLFVQVCHAVQHAHQKGVIHRDLKPSNVLVAPHDGAPVVKVIDFGIAKALGQPLTDKTLVTGGAQVLGTPLYMSPEQAGRGGLDVDTCSDVYALGVLLYELLAGATPLDPERLERVPREEILRVIREEEPPTPSARLGTLGPAATTVAANRRTEARRLGQLLRGELDWVAMKCLEKDRARRYATANGLAMDVQRYLADEPVLARPPSAAYRVRKFVRRNPAAAAALSLAVAASVVTAVWAVRERDHAEAIAKQAKALGQALNERSQALNEAEYRSAENALDHAIVLGEGGDAGAGLLWLARSLATAPATAGQLRHTVQAQFAGWGRHVLPLQTCFDNPGPVTAASLSPDGRTVWVAGQDKALRRWDVTDVTNCRLLDPPLRLAATARLIVWSPGGAAVLTVAADGTAQRWDAATGRSLGAPLPHKASTAAWSPDGRFFVTGGADGTVRRWDAATGDPQGPGCRQPDAVIHLAVSPDGRTLLTVGWKIDAAGAEKGTARFWDAATGDGLGEPLPYQGTITAAAFSPDRRTFVTADNNRYQLWDAATRRPLGGPVRHKGSIRALAFSPDGRTLLVGGNGRSARLYDPATGLTVGQPLAHRETVLGVGFTGDGRRMLTAGADGAVRLWDAALDRPLGRTLWHESHVRTAVFSTDGRIVLTASFDNTARLWDAATGKPLGEPLPHPSQVMAAAFGPGGRSVLTVCWGSRAWLWDVATRQAVVLGHPVGVRVKAAVFSPDGRTVLTGDSDGSVRFWDAATGALRGGPFPAHAGLVMAVAVSPDGGTACTGSEDGTARLWDMGTGRPRGPVLPHQGTVWAIAFSPDGGTVLTGSWDGTARLWDAATGTPREPALEHGDRITAVAFSPDDQMVLTAGEDGTARLWHAATCLPVGGPLAHHDRVVAAAFSPDGRAVLTGSYDGTARLWDVATGKPLGPPLVHDGRVRAVAFSPDGRAVLTGSEDHAARLWPLLAPAAGTPEQVPLQAEVLTGLELDAHDVLHVLDAARWHDRRRRLQELAAPAGAG